MEEKLVHIVLPNQIIVQEAHSDMQLPTWEALMIDHGVPFWGYFAGMMYTLYLRMSLVNVCIFMLKYTPMVVYLYKLVKDVVIASRKKIKLKQSELEEIKLQIQITSTKISEHDACLEARARCVRQAAERLRRVRARVRALIATDDALKHTIDSDASMDDAEHATDEDQEFLDDLLKDLCVQGRPRQTNKNCGEPNDASPEDSVYTAAQSEADAKNDCQVKIVKVTNVYKVAYLRHFIKQKRLMRATKQALLKSKMETVKNLFDDWQKALTMVINTKLSILTTSQLAPAQCDDASASQLSSAQRDDGSQAAMGDFSKPNLRSDSDCEMRPNDLFFDEVWAEGSYKNANYESDYDDLQESPRGYYLGPKYGEVRVATPRYPCDCSQAVNNCALNSLFVLPEETNSEIAIEEIVNEEIVNEDIVNEEILDEEIVNEDENDG